MYGLYTLENVQLFVGVGIDCQFVKVLSIIISLERFGQQPAQQYLSYVTQIFPLSIEQ